ncbi:unnamed protein product [Sphenostylis stenocarpa]|uniref:Uncharacterized protein n=1 Tax=Sphenostylis stenocarpa TaxID=92480 RepID=A0AA86VZ04_9FABA|nr:unnamed protein product [Sphenostylis stenocarpa]
MTNMDKTITVAIVMTEPDTTDPAPPASGAGIGEPWAETLTEKRVRRRKTVMVRKMKMILVDAMERTCGTVMEMKKVACVVLYAVASISAAMAHGGHDKAEARPASPRRWHRKTAPPLLVHCLVPHSSPLLHTICNSKP